MVTKIICLRSCNELRHLRGTSRRSRNAQTVSQKCFKSFRRKIVPRQSWIINWTVNNRFTYKFSSIKNRKIHNSKSKDLRSFPINQNVFRRVERIQVDLPKVGRHKRGSNVSLILLEIRYFMRKLGFRRISKDFPRNKAIIITLSEVW